MFAPANTAHFRLDIPRLEHDFKVLSFQGTEAISQPYCFELDLVSEPHEPEGYGHELDLIKGYGLLSLLLELDGGGNLGRFASEKLTVVAAKMTPEQIKQALKFAEEWKATHPPVSYFPDKLSIY